MIAFTITEGQLVRLFHGVPETAWFMPDDDDATIVRTLVDDMGGHCFCDVLLLSDSRAVIVAGNDAALYPSLDAAHDCAANVELVRAGD